MESLSFQELARRVDKSAHAFHFADLHDQEVEIRGFLYQYARDGHSRWVLASEPNVKTCCLGAHTKKFQQIEVTGISQPPISAQSVTLRGQFAVIAQKGEIQGFLLKEAQVQAREKLTDCPICFSALLILGVAVVMAFYLPKR